MNLSIQNIQVQSACQSKKPTLRHRVSTFLEIARQRRDLAALDAHMLVDIGVTRSEAIAESQKAVWNAPLHWR
ncbi:MAG: hypothetical protein ACJAZ1_002455 [Yoonia sp.]|jgi:uncharacterized protein YjiS (DUF1127 family)